MARDTKREDEAVKIEFVYGLSVTREEFAAKVVGPSEPRDALEAMSWVAQALLWEVVVPAFVFACGFTGFVMVLK